MLHGASADEAVSARGAWLSDNGPLFKFSKGHNFYREHNLIVNNSQNNLIQVRSP